MVGGAKKSRFQVLPFGKWLENRLARKYELAKIGAYREKLSELLRSAAPGAAERDARPHFSVFILAAGARDHPFWPANLSLPPPPFRPIKAKVDENSSGLNYFSINSVNTVKVVKLKDRSVLSLL